MIITEKQLIILFEISLWFSQVHMNWRFNQPPFSRETVEQIVNDILNQQSNKLMEVK